MAPTYSQKGLTSYSRFKKGLVIAAAAVITIGGAGAAFAYWTAGGVGDGEATTGQSAGFTVATGALTGDPLVPDGESQTLAFSVTNDAETAQFLTSVTVTVANADGSAWGPPAPCSVAAYEVVATQPDPGELAPDEEFDGVITITLHNTPLVSQDGCKGQDVPVHVAAA